MKNIHRSSTNYVWAGVIGGLTTYFGWNTSAARGLVFILGLFLSVPTLIAYLVLWMIMGDPA